MQQAATGTTNTLSAVNTEATNILKAAQEEAPFDKILKFKKGQYVIGNDDVALGTEFLAYAAAWTKMWIKFVNDAVVERRVYRVAHGERPPQREELDETDETTWRRGRDGKPADPWVFQYLLPLENQTTGEIVVFTTSTIGGRQAVSDLCKTYAKRKIDGKNGQPIVALAVAEMKTKNYGNVSRPSFEIVGWDDAGQGLVAAEVAATVPVKSERKAVARNPQHNDMDDEIPF